jgi:menaquinone-specific isochorismate synthase
LAVNIAWDKALNWTLRASICKALLVLSKVTGGVSWSASHERRTSVVESKHHSPDEGAWTHAVRSVLEVIKDSSHGSPPVVSSRYLPNGSVSETKPGLSKVVLARRTKLELSDALDPLTLLASLQEKDPNAYQFCLQLPDGSAFIGSTPERLFARKGLLVASEAVAATRPRGPTSSEDLGKAIDLLLR